MDRDPSPDGGESVEEIPDEFLCCVCLEVLHKPVVLKCGHISCFWCVHKSMSRWHSSRCPICRNVYNHFPSVCRTLHFLLMKLYPITYRQREEHISREERQTGCFSPQFGRVEESQSNKLIKQEQEGKYPNDEDRLEPVTITEDNGDATSGQKDVEELEAAREREVRVSQNNLKGNHRVVKPTDLLCLACKELLFQPVVLNCGDVLCQVCVVKCTDEKGQLKCHICESTNPKGCSKVCLVLNQFLQENFPKEYALRRDFVLANQKPKSVTSLSDNQNVVEGGSTSASGGDHSMIHPGVGCDSCGVFPIFGERYNCKDCEDRMGYDLCGDCYRSRSKLLGRFNQRHTKDHRLELVEIPAGAMRLISRGLRDAAATVFLYQRLLPNQNDAGSDNHQNDTSSD